MLPLTVREGCRLRMSVNSADENIGPKRQKYQQAEENHILRNIIVRPRHSSSG
jgi:hypothetical protein